MPRTKKTTSSPVKDLEVLESLDANELRIEIENARKELFILRMKHTMGELKQPHTIRTYRKYVAQASTILSLK